MTTSGAYVGRVGGLAVALGIGAAITVGQGVAWADPSDSSVSPDSSASPESSPGSSSTAAGGPVVASGGSIKHGSVSPRGNPNLSTDGETMPSKERPASTPTSGEPTVSREVGEEHTVTGDPAVTPDPVSEMSQGVAASSKPSVGRSSMSSQHSTPMADERWRSRGEPDSAADGLETSIGPDGSVSRMGQHAVDIGTVAEVDINAVESAGAETTASSMLSSTPQSTTTVDRDPQIDRAAPIADEMPGIITLLLAPLGIGGLVTNTPHIPVSPKSLMGFLELMRRELNRIFFNKTPAVTYELEEPANGAITGKVIPVDTDSTAFVYTATSPAEGDVFIDSDGTFVFVPNDTYEPTKGANFDVTISDASSDFHIHGVSGLLNLVTFGLIGESGHTYTQTIAVSGEVPPIDFQRTAVVSGLSEPTDFRFLPPVNENDPDRILIAEKGGAIKVHDGSEMQTLTTLPVYTHWARGVNGIEVDPQFNTNGYIYVSYIGADNYQRLSRFTVTNPTGDMTIDPTSEKVLIQGTEPAGDDHHGGEIRYIGGKLYYATGDNVCCSVLDGSRSQRLDSMYGKVLRINPDGTVPTDNPFHDGNGPNYDAIYAMGLRNPFRGGVTPDGRLLLGDVGQNTWEEINLVSAGANFGWPYAEGVCPGPGVCQPGSDGKTNPIYAYHEPVGGSSITSVLVYTGDGFGDHFDNAVFFADHNRQWVKVMHCDAGYSSCGAPSTFIVQMGRTTRLEQGPDGNIYQLTYDDGMLWRIAPSSDELLTV
jgi:aldose sugar dehydrogenase